MWSITTEKRLNVLEQPATSLACDPAQFAALVSDHSRHRDRRQRGDYHGDAWQWRDPCGIGSDCQPWQQFDHGAARSTARPRSRFGRRTPIQD